ncbi:putative membrane protein YeaQ/YmgE (transglycosylase-associated protein family) [Thalassospira sp. MBR-102]|jgi:uncharacterized membrane protein YeaQ/YmgE (transglycosylase-associated protein family)|nr:MULTISPECIES: hypothetical protein [Thalassospira]MBR9780315.1 hypothetical protein [Rhodospirillales bacterium]MBL4843265.1 hypothetical protein [Thalassospira sp.]MBO9509817.1 hypothetical protein [Thalassospira sp. A3_1]MBR9815466.1 hypothetical protein [Rhodospirillales bacterium]MCD1594531.1 hypothetical protein [Thalassospira xiamenensis]|tara:strand:+ start:171 stop:467 length:297 start_codon:yes stop_codon:yes gene_type:complete
MSEIACPHCHYVSQNGVKVCIGCQAEVVYGSTSSEIKTAMLFGGIGASILSSIIMANFFGYSFAAMLVFAAIGAVVAVVLTDKAHHGNVRFVRRYFNH